MFLQNSGSQLPEHMVQNPSDNNTVFTVKNLKPYTAIMMI